MKRFLLPAIFVVVFAGGFLAGTTQSFVINNGRPDFIKKELDFTEVDEAWEKIKSNFFGPIDTSKIKDGLIRGLVSALNDPYSAYFNKEEADSFKEELASSITGIGAELGIRDDKLVVIAPISGSPAERSGVKAGDEILAIDDKNTAGISLAEAVKKIRGEAGTTVKLLLKSQGEQTRELSITRETIKISSVETKIVDGVGYIRINSFSEDTTASMREKTAIFLSSGITEVVLDLRSNPGGYFSQAVSVASEFVEQGVIVSEEGRGGRKEEFKAAEGGKLTNFQVAILIDKGTASAAEIVTGALRFHKRARVIGEKSFGKGTVQEPIELSDGSILKITIGKWLLPDGRNIEGEGIVPDQEAKKEGNEDKPLNLAVKYLKEN